MHEQLLQGLDFLLVELRQRGMTAVLYLNNFWQWSGGMTQYLNRFTGSPAHDPDASKDWSAFMAENGRFYTIEEAQQEYRLAIAKIVNRVNTINRLPCRDDPVIMAWQPAHEPRPGNSKAGAREKAAYARWIAATARYIRSLDGRLKERTARIAGPCDSSRWCKTWMACLASITPGANWELP